MEAEVGLGEVRTAHCIIKHAVLQAMGGVGERPHRSIKVNGHANSYVRCSHMKNTFSVMYGYKHTCIRIALLHS